MWLTRLHVQLAKTCFGRHLRMPPSETLKRFNEALQRFRIYPLSYEAMQRFIEALSNLTRFRLNLG